MKVFDLTKKKAHFVFLVTLFACFLVNSGSLSSSDALRRLQVTHWIWLNAPQVAPPGLDITGLHGKQYAQWGIGQSLLMLPADVITHPLINRLHPGPMRNSVQVGLISYLTFPLLNAVTAVLVYFLLLELKFSTTESVLGVLAVVFATSFLPYAQIQQEISLMFFSLIGGFLGNILWLRTGKFQYLCFGVLVLGWGFLVRVPCIIDAFTVAVFVMVSILWREQDVGEKAKALFKYAITFGALYAPFILADRLYQWMRFGSFTTTYFAIQEAQARAADPSLPANFPFSTPFHHGFLGFLFSPAKSIFLCNPLIILVAVLVVKYWKSLDRQVILFFLLSCFLLLADMSFYARFQYWYGDSAWGPRYAIVPSQLVSLIAVPV